MPAIEPYWNPKIDLSGHLFHMRKVERTGFFDVSDVPEVVLPLFSFVYLLRGEVLLEVEGRACLCKQNQILLVPRNVPFRVLYFKENIGYECAFSLRFLKDVSYDCLHVPHPLLQTFEAEDAAFTAALLEQIYQSFHNDDLALTASALDLFLCRLRQREGKPENALVSRFLEMVFNRNEKPGKVSDYAETLFITPNYLNRLVRANTGHSAMEWIEISRLNLAKSLLKQNRLQVSEIAAAVGIDDQSYFTRFFKKNEGFTPTRYREMLISGIKNPD